MGRTLQIAILAMSTVVASDLRAVPAEILSKIKASIEAGRPQGRSAK